MMNESIQSLMTKEVITLQTNQTLGDAHSILMNNRVHHIPVLEGKKLVGMITSWDIFKLGKSYEDYQGINVQEVMTRRLATSEPDQHVGAVAEILMEHLFHAVPIVNDDHELVGIITSYDLLRYEFRKEYPEDLSPFVPLNM